MEINLLDFVKNQISGTVINKTASFLGENSMATQKAFAVLLPSVLGGIANKATSLSGADNLLGLINKAVHDGNIFQNLESILTNNAETEDLINKGGKTNSFLFGDKINDIAVWVANHAGIKSGSAWSLMNFATPILMGAISKNMDSSRTASSLVSLLGSQLSVLRKTIPSDLVGIMNLSQLNLSSTVKQEEPRAAAIPKPLNKTPSNDKPLLSRLLPWLLLLAGALAGLYYLSKRQTDEAISTPIAAIPTTDTLPNSIEVVSDDKVLKLGDEEIKVKKGTFLDLFYTTIMDANADLEKSIIFDNVNFAKYKTDLTDSSKTQLDDLVKIMKTYPSVNIKINAYTDSRGDADENKTLSSGRAASVKSYLMSKGIDSERLTSEGKGQSNPIADNDLEMGRAKNRRIEAVVTKK